MSKLRFLFIAFLRFPAFAIKALMLNFFWNGGAGQIGDFAICRIINDCETLKTSNSLMTICDSRLHTVSGERISDSSIFHSLKKSSVRIFVF